MKYMEIVCLFILQITAALKGAAEAEGSIDRRIVGGYAINIRVAPYQAIFGVICTACPCPPHYEPTCGAVIIGQVWTLTAAHCTICVEDLACALIRVGSEHRITGGTAHNVQKIIQHEKYKAYLHGFDIALVKVSNGFIYSDSVRPVPLATETPADNTMVFVSGFGSDRIGGPPSLVLRQVQVTIVNRERCQRSFEDPLTNEHLCAGGGGRGHCTGDSGGPLVTVLNERLVGIASEASAYNCTNRGPGVFSSIPYYRRWIREHSGI